MLRASVWWLAGLRVVKEGWMGFFERVAI